MFAYEFMRNAMLASTFIAITTGVVGVFVVSRKLSFLAHTLSEIGFAGAAFAVVMGISPLYGMLLFTLLGAVSVGGLSQRSEQKESSISAISAIFIGLGILFLSLSGSTSKSATNILFGSIIGVDQTGVKILVALSIVVILVLTIFYRGISFTSFDLVGARAHGLNTSLLSVIFLLLLATSVSVGSQIVGSMLVFILLTLPASSAQYLGKSISEMMIWSVFFAIFGVWMGLYLGYLTNLPVTFFISTIEVVIYLVVYVINLKRN